MYDIGYGQRFALFFLVFVLHCLCTRWSETKKFTTQTADIFHMSSPMFWKDKTLLKTSISRIQWHNTMVPSCNSHISGKIIQN